MAKFYVFVASTSFGNHDFAYGLSYSYEQTAEAAVKEHSDDGALFAIHVDEVMAACPQGISQYEHFGPYFAYQADLRGIKLTDYYAEKYLLKGRALYGDKSVVAAKPRKPPPELPPFWWEDPDHPGCSRVKPDAAMAAVRAMCAGGTRREAS